MNKKIWILSHHRTGSGFFCEVLGKILNLDLKEFLAPWKFDFDYLKNQPKLTPWELDVENKILIAPDDWKNFKYKWIELDKLKIPSCSKIHHDTLKGIFGDFKSFKNKIGNSYFIKTSRKNIIEHTASLYIAMCLNKWRIESLSDKFNKWDKRKIEINDKNLINCYKYVKSIKNKWSCVEDPSINIYYEDFVKNPFEEIKKVLKFLKIDCSDDKILSAINCDKNIIKQTHPDRDEVLKRIEKLVKHL